MDWSYAPLLGIHIQMMTMYWHWKIHRNGLQFCADQRRDAPLPRKDIYDHMDYHTLVGHVGHYCDNRVNIWCSDNCPWAIHSIEEMPNGN